MVNRCVVNGCTSGSVSDRNKHRKLGSKNPSLFTVPQHLDLLELWESELSQKLVPKKNYVCELHFNEEDIIKSDKIETANGIIEELVRERYALKQGAIPTLNPKKLSESRNIKDVNSPNSPSTEVVASEPNNIVYINENYSHQDSELQIDEDCNSNYDRLENFNSRISSEEINHENEEPMFCFIMDCKMSCKWKKGHITPNSNVSFHRFPSDKELFTKWLEAIGVKHTSVISWQYNMYLCSNHFKKEDFDENLSSYPPSIRKLRSSAIPSILKSTESHRRSLSSKICTNDKTKRNHLEGHSYSTDQKMDMNQLKKENHGESEQTFGATQDHSRISVKPYKPRYLGDVCLSDMGNPERAKWCLMLAKKVLAKQTKHIKQLKKENSILYEKMDRLRKIERIVKNTPENPGQSKETITLQEKPTFKAADENEDATVISLEDTNATFSTVRFSDLISRVAQAQFRRYYKRRVKPGAVDIVTLQDIKDVVLFTAEVTDLSTEFIKFFHLPTTDAFLRASIVYFQYYFQVWEHVKERREEAKRKLTQPIVTVLEDIIMENLGDLRSILSREYHRLTCGMGDAWQFYHLSNKNNVSTSDKDRRLFEALLCVSARVIWCALHRKNLFLIETELNRLIRTKVFNFIQRRPKKVDTFDLSPGERRYIWGNACRDEKKLKHRSPAAQELMFANHDYKMLAIGVRSIKTSDPRQKFLEIAYTAPEDKLFSLGVGIGILGYPRDRLDTLLQPRERTKTDVLGEELVVPPFDLPPKSDSKDEEFTQSLPQTKPLYTESEDTAKVRKSQANLWIRHVERCGNILFTDATSGSVQISIPES